MYSIATRPVLCIYSEHLISLKICSNVQAFELLGHRTILFSINTRLALGYRGKQFNEVLYCVRYSTWFSFMGIVHFLTVTKGEASGSLYCARRSFTGSWILGRLFTLLLIWTNSSITFEMNYWKYGWNVNMIERCRIHKQYIIRIRST